MGPQIGLNEQFNRAHDGLLLIDGEGMYSG